MARNKLLLRQIFSLGHPALHFYVCFCLFLCLFKHAFTIANISIKVNNLRIHFCSYFYNTIRNNRYKFASYEYCYFYNRHKMIIHSSLAQYFTNKHRIIQNVKIPCSFHMAVFLLLVHSGTILLTIFCAIFFHISAFLHVNITTLFLLTLAFWRFIIEVAFE